MTMEDQTQYPMRSDTHTPDAMHGDHKDRITHPSHIAKLPRQPQQRCIRNQAQHRQQHHRIAARPELAPQHAVAIVVGRLGDEELAVALVAAPDGDKQDGGAKGGEEGADAVELLGEDLEDDEGEGEDAEGGAHVGAFEGALGGADFDESGELVSDEVLDDDARAGEWMDGVIWALRLHGDGGC
ncbi:hypothetical protein CCMA1212_007962 [Trichoderma ghanense]|uniref:Uncharacterized protein n=1 Tax=Trichoderma ghanense TaxID=65468 RepID=A0ABY2GXL3_9HYPO